MRGFPSITAPELLAMLARPEFGDPSGPWHAWFAWRPVKTVDGRLAWLRTVYRRGYHTKAHLDGPQGKWFIYARGDGYVGRPAPDRLLVDREGVVYPPTREIRLKGRKP